jgi:K+-transporting ATPase KdpF subunit
MDLELVASAVLAVLLLAYLIVALLQPKRFG